MIGEDKRNGIKRAAIDEGSTKNKISAEAEVLKDSDIRELIISWRTL